MTLLQVQKRDVLSIPFESDSSCGHEQGRGNGAVVRHKLGYHHALRHVLHLLGCRKDEAETPAAERFHFRKFFDENILNTQWVDQSGHNNPPHAKQLNNDVLAPNTRDCAGYSEYRRAGQSHHGVKERKSPLQISVNWERSLFFVFVGVSVLVYLAWSDIRGGW